MVARKFGLAVLGLAALVAIAAGGLTLDPKLLSGDAAWGIPMALGEPFTLIDDHGKSFSSMELKGKPFAIFFGFTHCPDECPTTMSDLTQAVKLMGPDANKLNVVFVTFDPARDTPTVLADWMKYFDSHFIALTGPATALDALAKSYHVYFKPLAPDKTGNYDFTHSAATYLMDARGRFVGQLTPNDTPKVMKQRLEQLVEGKLG